MIAVLTEALPSCVEAERTFGSSEELDGRAWDNCDSPRQSRLAPDDPSALAAGRKLTRVRTERTEGCQSVDREPV
jgi:hypothetical protein